MKKITRRQFLKTTTAVGVLGAAASAGAVPAGACIDPPPAAGYPQQLTIGAYDWGPGVSSTRFKLRQFVRAEGVQASDFGMLSETKDSYDWYQLYPGAESATVSGQLPVADAYPCNGRPPAKSWHARSSDGVGNSTGTGRKLVLPQPPWYGLLPRG